MTQHKQGPDIARVARVGMMCAIALVLSRLKIPMTFFAPWLDLDLSYVPTLLTGFALGFPSGLVVLALTNIIQLLLTTSGGVGQLADLLVGMALLFPAALMYGHMKSRRGALIGMLLGTLLMVICGVLVNRFILLPVFFGDGFADFMAGNPTYLWAAAAPFNALKGVVVSALTFLIYKRLSPFLKRGLRG